MLDAPELIVLTVSISLIVLIKTIDRNPPPIFGIYQRPNGFYWLKVAFFYIILSLRKLKRLNKDKEERLFSVIEKPQKLSNHEQPIDAVYLNGFNKNGDHIIVGLARRNNLLVDGFLYAKINGSNLGLLEGPKLPSTSLYKTEDNEEYSAEGLKMIPVEPMKKWRLLYEGKMKEFDDRSKVHDVKIDGVWTSDLPYFNLDSDMDPLCVAKATAYEKWSKAYFDNLRKHHQTHYEQFGILNAEVTIDNIIYNIELDTLRDHSFGDHREWRSFKRYGLHFFATEDGNRFAIGQICCPILYSRLTIGHVYTAKHKKTFPVRNCDFELYQHGELGSLPKDYAFSFTAGDDKYTVKVNVMETPHLYISKDWEAKIFEGLSTFEVNGVRGWGAIEWQYRNIEGKNVPDYTKDSK